MNSTQNATKKIVEAVAYIVLLLGAVLGGMFGYNVGPGTFPGVLIGIVIAVVAEALFIPPLMILFQIDDKLEKISGSGKEEKTVSENETKDEKTE